MNRSNIPRFPRSNGKPRDGLFCHKTTPTILGISLSLLIVVALPAACYAQAVIAKEVLEQAAEQIFRQAGKDGLEELSEMGGRAAVRELLERSASEGGETLVKKVVQYGAEDGPVALRVINLAPREMVEAIDGLSPGLRSSAFRAIDRDPRVMTTLVKRFGTGAAEVAVRQPGTGEILMQKLGADGIRLCRSLSADESVLVARQADEIAILQPTDRAAVIDKILSSPAQVLSYLERHPKVLATAAGVALFLATKDELLGDKGSSVIQDNGKVVTAPSHPGLIERLIAQFVPSTKRPIELIGYVIASGIAVSFSIHLVAKWQRHRAALRAVEIQSRNIWK